MNLQVFASDAKTNKYEMFACVHHVAHTELLLHSSAFCLRAYTNERNTRHLMLFYSRILLGTHPSFRRKQQLLILTSPPPAPRERTCARWPGDIGAANDKFDRFYIFIYSRMHFHFFFVENCCSSFVPECSYSIPSNIAINANRIEGQQILRLLIGYHDMFFDF